MAGSRNALRRRRRRRSGRRLKRGNCAALKSDNCFVNSGPDFCPGFRAKFGTGFRSSLINLYAGADSGPDFWAGFRAKFGPGFRRGWTDPGPKFGPESGPDLKPDSGTGKIILHTVELAPNRSMLMLSMQCESSKYASVASGWGQPGFWGRQAVSNSEPKTTKFAWSIFFQKTPPLSNRARRGISPKLEDSPSRPMGSNSLAKFVSRLGFKSKPVGYRRKKNFA